MTMLTLPEVDVLSPAWPSGAQVDQAQVSTRELNLDRQLRAWALLAQPEISDAEAAWR